MTVLSKEERYKLAEQQLALILRAERRVLEEGWRAWSEYYGEPCPKDWVHGIIFRPPPRNLEVWVEDD